MRQNRKKFGRDQNAEFKKSLEPYHQISFKVLTKVNINIIPFAWTKVNEMKLRANICSKEPFSTNHSNKGNI
jgi:hypothetical protein